MKKKASNNVVINTNKTDLFSSFLIEYDDNYILLPSIIRFLEPLKSFTLLLSLANNVKGKKNETSKKGVPFENIIMEYLLSINKKTIKNISSKSYELDVISIFEDIIFVFECKTQKQHENVADYCKNLYELEFYLQKFQKNIDYFFENPNGKQSLKDQFKKNNISVTLENKKIIPVFVSNISYPQMKMDGIYIINETKLFNFAKQIPPCIHFGDNCVIFQLKIDLFQKNDSKSLLKFLENNQKYAIDYKKAILEKTLKFNTGSGVHRYKIEHHYLDFDNYAYEREIEIYLENGGEYYIKRR